LSPIGIICSDSSVLHPVILLVQKIELHYPKEIQKFFAVSKKQRTEKFYKLITIAKNEEQLDKSYLKKYLPKNILRKMIIYGVMKYVY
jgi:K+-transporting ATPase A subunit